METNIVREFDKKISDETIINIPRKKTYDEIIDELEEENENLASNMPWNTTEQATEISVDDAAKYSRNKLELFENTEQAQYEGTNLSEWANYSETLSSLMIEWKTDNNLVKFNGTYTATINSAKANRIKTPFILRAGETYYIHLKKISGTHSHLTSTKKTTISFVVGNSRINWDISDSSDPHIQSVQLTPSEDITINSIRLLVQYGNNDTTFDDYTLQFWVSSNSEPDHEPYVGEKFSPSADFPQDIHKVTGIIKTEIASENIFNIKQNYVVGQFKDDGTINTNIQANINIAGNTMTVTLPNNNPSGWISNLVEFISKETHILSFNAERNTFKIIIAEYNKNQQYIKQTSLANSSSRSIQLQPDNNTKYIRFIFENITNNFSNNFSSIQFRKETIVRDYEEYYNEQIELNFEENTLANVGTAEDIPFKNTIESKYYNSELTLNNWYIYSQCVFKTFTGNEKWTKYTSSSESTLLKAYFMTNQIADIEQVDFNYTQQGLCNIGRLGDVPARSYTSHNREGVSVGSRSLYVCFKKFEDMTVEEFKEYLHENPIVILCKRAAPAYIPLTDETLVKNLDKIYEHLKLIKGTNNITITSSDLPPKMKLTYMQDLPSKLDKLEAMVIENS